MKKHNYKRLPYEQIKKAVAGDAEAMTALVKLYMPFIKKLSYGDQEIEDRVISRLMRAATQFNLDYEG